MDRVSVPGDTIIFGSASPSILPILLVLTKMGIEERTVGRLGQENWGGEMARPRAADDFAAIRERMEELRRERGQWTRDQHGRDDSR